jgi:quercetin dioxygenase-like cupin family protein
MKRLSFISTLVAWMLTATVALATPASLFVATPIARATFGGAINTGQIAGRQSVIQQLTIAPGGHTGWHTHPGGTVILVQGGTFTLYNDACAKTVTPENRGVVEPGGHVQLARNETTGLLLLTVVYFDVPVGGAVRSNAETPACAVGADANNLPEGPAGSGITFNVPGGIVQRSTFAAASTITSAAERDVLVQRVTIAPGGHSGWHSHPGATVVYVESGTLTIYDENCVKQANPAGQGVVEPANHRVLARNEGASPTLVRVVFFDVPVAGSARIDQPEPATCTGLVAGATPQTLPSTSVETIDSAGPSSAIIALLVALASVVGLALLGRTRRRSRTS